MTADGDASLEEPWPKGKDLMPDPAEELYAAEAHMRAHHRVDHPHWAFWHEIADWFNSEASKVRGGATGKWNSARWREFNRALAAARHYTNAVEDGQTPGLS